MSFLASFIALAVGGILTAGHLVWQHHKKKKSPLVCPLNHDCSHVTESKWSKIFYFRNETLGLLYYVGMLVAGILLVVSPSTIVLLPLWISIGAGVAFLFSLFLVGIQAWVIKDYCFYCLISAGISLLLFINSFFLWGLGMKLCC